MDMYLFEDPKLAEEFRELGIPVIKTHHANKEMFAIPDKPEFAKFLMEHYADLKLRKTGTVCF